MDKRYKSAVSLLTVLALCGSITPAFAADTNTSGSKHSSDAILNAQAATFSVTVPTSLPINIDASGVITVATDAKIINNSVGPIKVTGCKMDFVNNWTITAKPSEGKVGSKEFGFTLNDKAFGLDGSYDVTDWSSINASDSLTLVYSSEVAPQSAAVKEAISNVVFTIDWDESTDTTPDVTPDKPSLNATHEIDKDKMFTALYTLTGNIVFRDSTEVPAGYNSATDVSTAGDKSVMCYITGQDAIVQADGGILVNQSTSNMFAHFGAAGLDLRGLDTSNIEDMSGMFRTSASLASVDLGTFYTSNVTSMNGMFSGCSSLTTLDLSSFDTSKVTDMSDIVGYCDSLTTVYVKTQADATRLSASLDEGSTITVTVRA